METLGQVGQAQAENVRGSRAKTAARLPIELIGGGRARLCTNAQETESVIGLFEQIARAEDWQPGDELRAHVARSTYFGLWISPDGDGAMERPDELLIGGLQLVRPDGQRTLPSHTVWPELPLIEAMCLSPVAHVAVLAVDKPWRGKGNGSSFFWLLVIELWRHCIASGIRELWLEATPTMLRCYRLLGWPLIVRGPLRTHWGEACYPCSLTMRDVAGALAEKAYRSDLYRSLMAQAIRASDESIATDRP